MGGRGSGSGVGRYGGGGGINPGDIVSTRDMGTEREDLTLRKYVDEVYSVSLDVNEEYGDIPWDFKLATLKGKGKSALAYYDGSNIAINEDYFSKNMTKAYADAEKSGFHPSSGKKTAMQAVAAHEFGHGLTDLAARNMGSGYTLDSAARRIVNEARPSTGHRGVVQMANAISRYASASNAEAIAEAYSDVYCNGKRAKSESKAIIKVLNSYLKK